jgi:hypothetical protein
MIDSFRRLGLNDPTVHAGILKALKTSPGLAAHEAAADPHPQYLQDADRVAWITEGFTPTVGQTTFTLAEPPTAESVHFIVNGVEYVNTADFTVSGADVTWVSTLFTLDDNDEVIVRYYVAAPVMSGGGSVYLPDGWI